MLIRLPSHWISKTKFSIFHSAQFFLDVISIMTNTPDPRAPSMDDIYQKNISANILKPSSNSQILSELMAENFKYQGKLGPTNPPEGGWHNKILAASDGSLKNNYGTAGFIAETSTKSIIGGIKISPPTHGKLSSYRSEGGGLLLMLLSLYPEKEENHLYAWCDNESLVE